LSTRDSGRARTITDSHPTHRGTAFARDRPFVVRIIGTGWCGGIRAETCAAHPLVTHSAKIVAART